MTPSFALPRMMAVAVVALLATACGDTPSSEGVDEAPREQAPEQAPSAALSFIRTPEHDSVRGERIVAAPPLNWELRFQTVNPDLRLIEYLPPDDDPSEQRLTFEAFNNDPMPAPLQALAGIAGNARARCPDFETYNTFSGEENNYPTAVALMICRQEPGTEAARISMVKTIQGNEYFYVVTRSHAVPALGPPPEGADATDADAAVLTDVVGALSLYLRTVTLCDDDRPDHPCTRRATDL